MDQNVLLSSGKMEKSLVLFFHSLLLIIFQNQISFSVDTAVIGIHS